MSTENASTVEALKAELVRAETAETLAVARFVSAEKAAEVAKVDAKIAYERIRILKAQIAQMEMPVEPEPIGEEPAPSFVCEWLVGPALCTDKVAVDGVPLESYTGSLEGYLRAYVHAGDEAGYHWTGFLYGQSVPDGGRAFIGCYADAVRWVREMHAKYSVLSMVELAAA